MTVTSARLYWDSSALASLVFEEAQTNIVRTFVLRHKAISGYSSFITELELESVFRRKLQQAPGSPVSRAQFRETLKRALSAVRLVHSSDAITREARRLISEYGLRSADAVQLATAVHIKGAENCVFLSFDRKLNQTASAEGFEASLM